MRHAFESAAHHLALIGRDRQRQAQNREIPGIAQDRPQDAFADTGDAGKQASDAVVQQKELQKQGCTPDQPTKRLRRPRQIPWPNGLREA